ncbi:MAG: tripartite tricarboxylate transporter substrate binding protein [Betaproteobacteria bacterium]|nr:tripartite tricarboxylate transporter substrate binding protein [Betaproteobacteria bacterium]
MSKAVRWISAAAFLAAAMVSPVAAQQWPEKPVRILVPFPPGGGTDIQARLLSGVFQKNTGQPFVVDNRTGASGIIAAQLAVDSPPDGYTLLFTSGSISVVTTLHAKRMKFNPLTDLQPISWLSSTPLVLSLHPSVPAKSVKELVALAKRKPGIMNAGGNSAGSTAHLSAEMLNQFAGLDSTVLFYRGGGPAVIALVSGEIDYIFATAPSIMPHYKAGKARAIAVTTPKRSSAFPDLPTMNSFYPGFESDNWYAMFFPKNTPRPIVDRMNAEIKKALGSDEVRKFMVQEALDPVASSPEELTTHFKSDIERYAKVIKAGNIVVD